MKKMENTDSKSKINITEEPLQTLETNLQECKICLLPCFRSQMYSLGCTHYFCKNCLIQYVNCRVKEWSYIKCFEDGCNQVINQSPESIYHLLPIKKKKKIDLLMDNFDRMVNIRKCKRCARGALIQKINQQNKRLFQCIQCREPSCYNCFGPAHSGKCTNLQSVDYPSNCTQCKKCRTIIEKKQGCSHIKCVCSYQFCFQCGYHWAPSHICQFKIKKRTGCSLYGCNLIKIVLLIPLATFVFAISICYVLLICFLSSLIFGFTGWINATQHILTNKNKVKEGTISTSNLSNSANEHRKAETGLTKCLFFIYFATLPIMLPISIVLLSIIGFFIPFYNLCVNHKIVLQPNILLQFVEEIRTCYDFYWII